MEDVREALRDPEFHAQAVQAMSDAWAQRPSDADIVAASALPDNWDALWWDLMSAYDRKGRPGPDADAAWAACVAAAGGWQAEPLAQGAGYTMHPLPHEPGVDETDATTRQVTLPLDRSVADRLVDPLDHGTAAPVRIPARDLVLQEADRAAECVGIRRPEYRATVFLGRTLSELVTSDIAANDQTTDDLPRPMAAYPPLLAWLLRAAARQAQFRTTAAEAKGGHLAPDERADVEDNRDESPDSSAFSASRADKRARADAFLDMGHSVRRRLWTDAHGHDLRGLPPSAQQLAKDLKSAFQEGPRELSNGGHGIGERTTDQALSAGREPKGEPVPRPTTPRAAEWLAEVQDSRARLEWLKGEHPDEFEAGVREIGLEPQAIIDDILRQRRTQAWWLPKQRRLAWEAWGRIVQESWEADHAGKVSEHTDEKPWRFADYAVLEWTISTHAQREGL
jgi:hypothetical protein